MPSHATSTIFVVGGTGAQGMPVIRALVADKKYSVRVLTRDPTSPRAQALLALGNVSILEGSFADEDVLREGFRGCDGAFVNIDGFNTGEKTEIYWAIRSYEIAIEEGIKFFVYGNLDYGLKKAGYDSRFRTGHYDGKGRMGEWILFQNQDNSDRMGAAVFTTGPYMEMVISPLTPMTPTVEDGVATWRVPLGDGAVPHVALEDCGYYARWLFDHPERANGMNLEVAIADLTYTDIAAAFEKVTGHPARYIDTDLRHYWNGPLKRAGRPARRLQRRPQRQEHHELPRQLHRLLERLEARKISRDYALLDEIHPNRIRAPSSGSAAKTSSEENSARAASGNGSSRRTGA